MPMKKFCETWLDTLLVRCSEGLRLANVFRVLTFVSCVNLYRRSVCHSFAACWSSLRAALILRDVLRARANIFSKSHIGL